LLAGATLRQDLDVNKELYGRELTNREIISTHPIPPPAAEALIAELNKYSPREEH
jgi:lipid-binding SYLF domain-containing protein